MSDVTSQATFLTISNEAYFLGTVALLNSLRLTSNDGPLVVLDTGLSKSQRERLARRASVMEAPGDLTRPWLLKAFPRFLDITGVIVIIDSDMIVTRSLSDVIHDAEMGRICVFPDDISQRTRWFQEWEAGFGLGAPLRRQTYVNAGFIALSTKHWPSLLSRFGEVLERVPAETVWTGGDVTMPFWAADQDALNALLMSEIPADAIEVLPAAHEVHPDDLARTKIIDATTLECALDGERPALLHYSMAPKAWDRRGWTRVRRDAFVQLFGRVACGADVSLRLAPRELPLWLRPGAAGSALLATLDVAHGFVARIRRSLPPRASTAILRGKRRLTGSSRS